MNRFRPTSRPVTLQNKAMKHLDEPRVVRPLIRKRELQVAGFLGMDDDARAALIRVLSLAERGKTGVAGRFMPDSGVSALLEERGIVENVEEQDFPRFRRIVIPYCGISVRRRKEWEETELALEDLSSPQVRRGQIALGLLRMEGAQGLVIGRHDDPESEALAGGSATRILEDTTDTSRLAFSPAFGVVCQTTLSPRKVAWLVQQLRFRYQDARVTFLNTSSPAMVAREDAFEKRLLGCDRAVIAGTPGEASCEALMETALRMGKPAVVVAGPDDLKPGDLDGTRIALSAGAFALDDAVRAVAGALAGR